MAARATVRPTSALNIRAGRYYSGAKGDGNTQNGPTGAAETGKTAAGEGTGVSKEKSDTKAATRFDASQMSGMGRSVRGALEGQSFRDVQLLWGAGIPKYRGPTPGNALWKPDSLPPEQKPAKRITMPYMRDRMEQALKEYQSTADPSVKEEEEDVIESGNYVEWERVNRLVPTEEELDLKAKAEAQGLVYKIESPVPWGIGRPELYSPFVRKQHLLLFSNPTHAFDGDPVRFIQWLAGVVDGASKIYFNRGKGWPPVVWEIVASEKEVNMIYYIKMMIRYSVVRQLESGHYVWRCYHPIGLARMAALMKGGVYNPERQAELQKLCTVLGAPQLYRTPSKPPPRGGMWLTGFFETRGRMRVDQNTLQAYAVIKWHEPRLLDAIRKHYKLGKVLRDVPEEADSGGGDWFGRKTGFRPSSEPAFSGALASSEEMAISDAEDAKSNEEAQEWQQQQQESQPETQSYPPDLASNHPEMTIDMSLLKEVPLDVPTPSPDVSDTAAGVSPNSRGWKLLITDDDDQAYLSRYFFYAKFKGTQSRDFVRYRRIYLFLGRQYHRMGVSHHADRLQVLIRGLNSRLDEPYNNTPPFPGVHEKGGEPFGLVPTKLEADGMDVRPPEVLQENGWIEQADEAELRRFTGRVAPAPGEPGYVGYKPEEKPYEKKRVELFERRAERIKKIVERKERRRSGPQVP
ncbi:hypothetical protein HK104_005676, partial [Borealophlyctis nickersoniae]